MALNENIMIRLSADTSNYSTKMAAASTQAEKLATALEKPGSKSRIASNLMAGMGLSAIALGVSATKMAADFDQSMSTIQADLQASDGDMQKLRAAAIQAGADTIYSANEAADGIDALGKAGLSTADILSGGLSGALNLAASDGMQVGEAAELMSTTLKQFNLEGADAGKVADALAAGAGKAVGSAHDLGLALNQAGLMANSMGVSMTEAVGTLAAFANAGMIGSDAGTSLKTMLQRLSNPTKEAQAQMDELGISVYDAGGQFVGLESFAGQLKTSLSGLTQEQRNAALSVIFGSDAVRAANVLYSEGSEGIKGWNKAVSESGFATDVASKKTDNLKGDLESLSGSFETLMINLGEGSQGMLRNLVQGADTLVQSFSSLPAPIQQAGIAMTAAVGGGVALHKALTPLERSGSKAGAAIGLLLDPAQRLKTAGPQVAAGIRQIGSAAAAMAGDLAHGTTTIGKGEVALAGLKTAGSGFISMMGGPWGVAIGVAVTAISGFISKQQAAKQRTDDLTASLQSGQSALAYFQESLSKAEGSAYTDGFWNKLSNGFDSVWDAVDKVGVKHSTYVSAIKGDKSAIDSVRESVDAYQKSLNFWGQWWDSSGSVTLEALSEQQANYRTAVSDSTQADKEAKQASVDKTGALLTGAEATGKLADSTQDAASADDILAEAFGATKDAVSDTAGALAEIIDAMQTYYGFAIDSSDAQIDLMDKIASANDTIGKNAKTLDRDTEAGCKNQSALNDIAEAAIKCAKAQAQNGESLNDIYPNIDKAHDAFVNLMQSLGKTPEEAKAAAQAYGLTRKAVDDLVSSLEATPDSKTIEVQVTGDAVAKFEQVRLAVKETPDGKHIIISGDNTDLLKKIAQAAGAKIDPKSGTLTLDSSQYMAALAMANGAKLDTKTGYLKGDNSDAMRKFLQTQGWKLSDKGFIVNADGNPAMSVLTNLSNYQIADKYFRVHGSYVDESGGTYSASGYRPKGATGNIPMSATGGIYDGNGFHRYKSGGYAFNGYVDPKWAPGTSTSDSVWLDNARIARGEYVENALATSYYGVGVMDALNRRAIPRETFAAVPQQQPVVVKVEMPKDSGAVTVNMPMKIVRPAAELSTAGTIAGRRALSAIRGARQ
jgi:TP901 family phage tail tape measure protein